MALINCPACEKECSMQAVSCPHCGQPLNRMEPPPKTWLVESILATVLCCLLGIVGIVNASKVEKLWAEGRRAEAIEASKNAKIWTIVAIAVGGGVGLIYGFLVAFGVMAGIMEGLY